MLLRHGDYAVKGRSLNSRKDMYVPEGTGMGRSNQRVTVTEKERREYV